MVTIQQLCEAAGGVSRGTISNYQKRGLLHSPVLRRHPTGRGMIGYWPNSALRVVREIKELLGTGLSIDEVQSRLRADNTATVGAVRPWVQDVIEKLRVRPFDPGTCNPELRALVEEHNLASATLLDLYTDLIAALVRDAGVGRDVARLIATHAGSELRLGRAMELFHYEHAPVLLFDMSRGLRIRADFEVPHDLVPTQWRALGGDSQTDEHPPLSVAVVLPLHTLLWHLYSIFAPNYAATRAWPRSAAVTAINGFQGDCTTEMRYSLVPIGGNDFAFSLPSDPRLVSVQGSPAPKQRGKQKVRKK